MKTRASDSYKPTLARHKNAPAKKRISITLDAPILKALDERRGPHGERIAQDLSRYYGLLAETRFALRAKLTTQRLSIVLDACNGWTIDSEAPMQLWIQVADAIREDHLDAKWAEVDPDGLIRRLQGLTWLESIALADAVERFWYAAGRDHQRRDPSRALD